MVLLLGSVYSLILLYTIISLHVTSADNSNKKVICPKRDCEVVSNPFDITRNDAMDGVKNSNNFDTNPGDMFRDISDDGGIKKISELHDSGFYTSLCWIEITTITETKNGSKSAIREYAITFETPSDIPDKYLNNASKNGVDDEESVPYKIFDRDTKKSEVVNFTTVSRSDDTIVRQNRKVLCGAGPVYTKEFMQWPNSDRKRVEIRVSPKRQSLIASDCIVLNATLEDLSTLPPTRRDFGSSLYSNLPSEENKSKPLDNLTHAVFTHTTVEDSEEEPTISSDHLPKAPVVKAVLEDRSGSSNPTGVYKAETSTQAEFLTENDGQVTDRIMTDRTVTEDYSDSKTRPSKYKVGYEEMSTSELFTKPIWESSSKSPINLSSSSTTRIVVSHPNTTNIEELHTHIANVTQSYTITQTSGEDKTTKGKLRGLAILDDVSTVQPHGELNQSETTTELSTKSYSKSTPARHTDVVSEASTLLAMHESSQETPSDTYNTIFEPDLEIVNNTNPSNTSAPYKYIIKYYPKIKNVTYDKKLRIPIKQEGQQNFTIPLKFTPKLVSEIQRIPKKRGKLTPKNTSGSTMQTYDIEIITPHKNIRKVTNMPPKKLRLDTAKPENDLGGTTKNIADFGPYVQNGTQPNGTVTSLSTHVLTTIGLFKKYKHPLKPSNDSSDDYFYYDISDPPQTEATTQTLADSDQLPKLISLPGSLPLEKYSRQTILPNASMEILGEDKSPRVTKDVTFNTLSPKKSTTIPFDIKHTKNLDGRTSSTTKTHQGGNVEDFTEIYPDGSKKGGTSTAVYTKDDSLIVKRTTIGQKLKAEEISLITKGISFETPTLQFGQKTSEDHRGKEQEVFGTTTVGVKGQQTKTSADLIETNEGVSLYEGHPQDGTTQRGSKATPFVTITSQFGRQTPVDHRGKEQEAFGTTTVGIKDQQTKTSADLTATKEGVSLHEGHSQDGTTQRGSKGTPFVTSTSQFGQHTPVDYRGKEQEAFGTTTVGVKDQQTKTSADLTATKQGVSLHEGHTEDGTTQRGSKGTPFVTTTLQFGRQTPVGHRGKEQEAFRTTTVGVKDQQTKTSADLTAIKEGVSLHEGHSQDGTTQRGSKGTPFVTTTSQFGRQTPADHRGKEQEAFGTTSVGVKDQQTKTSADLTATKEGVTLHEGHPQDGTTQRGSNGTPFATIISQFGRKTPKGNRGKEQETFGTTTVGVKDQQTKAGVDLTATKEEVSLHELHPQDGSTQRGSKATEGNTYLTTKDIHKGTTEEYTHKRTEDTGHPEDAMKSSALPTTTSKIDLLSTITAKGSVKEITTVKRKDKGVPEEDLHLITKITDKGVTKHHTLEHVTEPSDKLGDVSKQKDSEETTKNDALLSTEKPNLSGGNLQGSAMKQKEITTVSIEEYNVEEPEEDLVVSTHRSIEAIGLERSINVQETTVVMKQDIKNTSESGIEFTTLTYDTKSTNVVDEHISSERNENVSVVTVSDVENTSKSIPTGLTINIYDSNSTDGQDVSTIGNDEKGITVVSEKGINLTTTAPGEIITESYSPKETLITERFENNETVSVYASTKTPLLSSDIAGFGKTTTASHLNNELDKKNLSTVQHLISNLHRQTTDLNNLKTHGSSEKPFSGKYITSTINVRDGLTQNTTHSSGTSESTQSSNLKRTTSTNLNISERNPIPTNLGTEQPRSSNTGIFFPSLYKSQGTIVSKEGIGFPAAVTSQLKNKTPYSGTTSRIYYSSKKYSDTSKEAITILQSVKSQFSGTTSHPGSQTSDVEVSRSTGYKTPFTKKPQSESTSTGPTNVQKNTTFAQTSPIYSSDERLVGGVTTEISEDQRHSTAKDINAFGYDVPIKEVSEAPQKYTDSDSLVKENTTGSEEAATKPYSGRTTFTYLDPNQKTKDLSTVSVSKKFRSKVVDITVPFLSHEPSEVSTPIDIYDTSQHIVPASHIIKDVTGKITGKTSTGLVKSSKIFESATSKIFAPHGEYPTAIVSTSEKTSADYTEDKDEDSKETDKKKVWFVQPTKKSTNTTTVPTLKDLFHKLKSTSAKSDTQRPDHKIIDGFSSPFVESKTTTDLHKIKTKSKSIGLTYLDLTDSVDNSAATEHTSVSYKHRGTVTISQSSGKQFQTTPSHLTSHVPKFSRTTDQFPSGATYLLIKHSGATERTVQSSHPTDFTTPKSLLGKFQSSSSGTLKPSEVTKSSSSKYFSSSKPLEDNLRTSKVDFVQSQSNVSAQTVETRSSLKGITTPTVANISLNRLLTTLGNFDTFETEKTKAPYEIPKVEYSVTNATIPNILINYTLVTNAHQSTVKPDVFTNLFPSTYDDSDDEDAIKVTTTPSPLNGLTTKSILGITTFSPKNYLDELCNSTKHKILVKVKILMEHILEGKDKDGEYKHTFPIMGIEKKTEFDIKPKFLNEVPDVPPEKLNKNWENFLDDLTKNFFSVNKDKVQNFTDFQHRDLNLSAPGHDFNGDVLGPDASVQRLKRIRNLRKLCSNRSRTATSTKVENAPEFRINRMFTPLRNKFTMLTTAVQTMPETVKLKPADDVSLDFRRYLLRSNLNTDNLRNVPNNLPNAAFTSRITSDDHSLRVRLDESNNLSRKPTILNSMGWLTPVYVGYHLEDEPFQFSSTNLFPGSSKLTVAKHESFGDNQDNQPAYMFMPELHQSSSAAEEDENYRFLKYFIPSSHNPQLLPEIAPRIGNVKTTKETNSKTLLGVLSSKPRTDITKEIKPTDRIEKKREHFGPINGHAEMGRSYLPLISYENDQQPSVLNFRRLDTSLFNTITEKSTKTESQKLLDFTAILSSIINKLKSFLQRLSSR